MRQPLHKLELNFLKKLNLGEKILISFITIKFKVCAILLCFSKWFITIGSKPLIYPLNNTVSLISLSNFFQFFTFIEFRYGLTNAEVRFYGGITYKFPSNLVHLIVGCHQASIIRHVF